MSQSRLQADYHARQVRLCARADRACRVIDRAVLSVWRELLRVLDGPWTQAHGRAELLLRVLPAAVRMEIAGDLGQTVQWAHASTRWALGQALGVRGLRRVADVRDGIRPAHAQHGAGQPLSEEEAGQADGREGVLGAAQQPLFSWTDLLAPWRQPEPPDKSDLLSLLFPAPSPQRIDQIVYSSGWADRIRSGTGLADPSHLAQRISTGLMLGRSQEQIARDILPAVQGVASSARRIARTESMRVAGAVQMDAHQALGDEVVGYRLLATLDGNTRPWHAARNGHVYYREPAPGQKGYEQMPHPPQEPQDPAERPAGTPATAWNCRCQLVPVLRT